MFNVLPGGIIEPIKWSKDNLMPDRSIIVLDESSLTIYLWHGIQQGLVARRTALRQADSLKGHGYQFGKSIIGMDIKKVKEIDHRKVGRDSETDELYKELEDILNRKFQVIEDHIITFQISETEAAKAELKKSIRPKPTPIKAESKAKLKKEKLAPVTKKEIQKIEEKQGEIKVVSKPKKAIKAKEKPITTEESLALLKTIDAKLNTLINEFQILKTIIEEMQNPPFVKNLRAMKNAIKKGNSIDNAPNYPSKEEIIKKEIERNKKNI